MPKLTIERGGGFSNRFRRYDIEVDGKIVGQVGYKQTTSADVSEGEHTVRVRIAWYGSKRVDVDVGPHGARLICENNPHLPWLAVVYMFLPDRWLVLRPSGPA